VRARLAHPNRIGSNPVAVKTHELTARKGRLANTPIEGGIINENRNNAFGPRPEFHSAGPPPIDLGGNSPHGRDPEPHTVYIEDPRARPQLA
jgi:hypothetical protein